MRVSLAAVVIWASPALACDGAPVCQVDPDRLALTRIIDFEGLVSTMGPGRLVDEVLVLDGARFAEYFIGQTLSADGHHDAVSGAGLAPLTLQSGVAGSTKSLVFVSGTILLNGFGPAGFPKRHAQGEGVIAVQFDAPQPALSFEIRGGEAGAAMVQFLRNDGSEISTLRINGLAEGPVGFLRGGNEADISGIVITNTDPQGIAIDNLRFGPPPDLS